jgi:hypothetical protein
MPTIQSIKKDIYRKYGFAPHMAAFNAAARRDLGDTAPVVSFGGRRIVGDRQSLRELLALDTDKDLRARLLAVGWTGFVTSKEYDGWTMVVYCNLRRQRRRYNCLMNAISCVWVEQSTLNVYSEPPDAMEAAEEAQEQASQTERVVIESADIKSVRIDGLTHIGLDREYYAPQSLKDLQDALHANRVSEYIYESEEYDCDDFAIALKAGLARVGITSVAIVIDYAGGHAYNAVALPSEDGVTVRYIEPQTDEDVTDKIGRGEYAATRGYIIW